MVKKCVKDILISSAEYPHIPYEHTLKQAIRIFKQSVIAGERCIKPIIALVFKGNRVIGTLRMRDIIKGLEPNFLKHAQKAQGLVSDRSELAIIWDSLFDEAATEMAGRQVSEVMEPIRITLEPGDSIIKAAHIMINYDLIVVPVLDGGEKFLGIVRMLEVFDELSSSVLHEYRDNVIGFDVRVQA